MSQAEHSIDRVLVLKVIDGKKGLASSGLVDSRLFTGGNNLHARMDEMSCLWTLEYESGKVPQPFNQKFTTFGQLYKFADTYFKKRNINIVEVKE